MKDWNALTHRRESAIWHISSVCGCGFDQVSAFSPDLVPKPLSSGRDAPIMFQSRVSTAKLHSQTQCSSHQRPEKRTSLHRQETTRGFRDHILETTVIFEAVSAFLCKSKYKRSRSYFLYCKKRLTWTLCSRSINRLQKLSVMWKKAK